MLRWSAWLVLLGTASLAVWLATSDAALQWMVVRLEAASEGRLRIEQAQGALLGPIAVRRLTYAEPDLAVAAEDLQLVVGWRTVLTGALALRALTARSLEVRVSPAADSAPRAPQSLALPAPVAIDRLEIERLVWRAGGEAIAIAPLAGAYSGGPGRHRIAIELARTPWGDFGADVKLGAAPPFEIHGAVRYAGAHQWANANAEATAGGSLQRLELAVQFGYAGSQGAIDATLAPFEPDWLSRAALRWREIDAAAFVNGAPRTDAQFEAQLSGGGKDGFRGNATLRNAAAGPFSASRAPVVSLETGFAVRGARLTFDSLRADLGAAGRLRGDGEMTDGVARFDLAVEALDLQAVHASVRPTRLAGKVRADGNLGAQHLVLDLRDEQVAVSGEVALTGQEVSVTRFLAAVRGGELRGSGRLVLSAERRFAARAQARGFDPAAFGDWPRALLNGSVEAEGVLLPEWRAAIRAQLADSRYGDAPLSARARFELSPGLLSALEAQLQVGVNRLRMQGGFGRAGDALAADFDARNLAQVDPRLAGRFAGKASLLGMPPHVGGTLEATGSALAFEQRARIREARVRASVSGDAERRIRAEIDLADLKLPQAELRQARLAVSGRAAAHELVAQAKGDAIDARLAAAGGWLEEGGWRGTLKELVNLGTYRMALVSAASLEWRKGHVAFGPAVLKVLDGEFALDAVRVDDGRLQSAGRLRALPVASLLAVRGWRAPPDSDLRLKGEWSIAATPRLNGRLRIEREAGDLMLSQDPRVAAEIQAVSLEARIRDDVIDLDGALRTQRKGAATLKARIAPAPAAAPGVLGAEASVEGTLAATAPTLSAVQAFIGAAAAIDGRLEAELRLGGTLGAPRIAGTARADRVRLDMPQHALALREGTAAISLDERALRVEKLSIRGGDGELRASGEMPLSDAPATLAWHAERLRLFNRPDRQLVLSGSGTAALIGERVMMRGALTADLGVFEVAARETERLGDDVVVVGRKAETARAARRAPPLALDLSLDAGERLQVRAQGLDAALRGRLRVRTGDDGELVGTGAIETRGGSYRAFGQPLSIERGRLLFDGPVTNPGLDILAMRKNQDVEAGVQVSGTVRSPVVRLVSNPPVPEHEKLSWLILGRGAATASGAEMALLQATLSALSDREGSLSGRLERGLGVDEVGLRGGAAGPALAIGKRLSDRVILEYEQGLTAAAALVRLRYTLSRTLNVSAEASSSGGSLGIGYGKSYD